MIAVQPLALGALSLLGREPIGMRRRVVDELGEQHGAGGGERAARPPQVQRRGVAVADRLLARGLPVDRLQRQRHLDQLALRCAHGIVLSIGRHRLRTAPGRAPRSCPTCRGGRWRRSRRRRSGRTGSRGSGPRRARSRAGRPARAPGGSAARLFSAVSTSLWVTKKSSAPAMRALTSIRIGSSPSRCGQDVEAGVVEGLLDRVAAERALSREHEVDAAALDLLRLHGVHRRVGRDLGLDGRQRQHERRGDDPRRLGLHLELPVEQRKPRSAPALEVGRLVHQARLGLLGFLAGLLLLLGDHRLEDQPVALLIQAPLDLVAHLVQLGLAAQLDLAEVRRELVGDDPARRLLLGVAPATAVPGPR